MAPLRLGITVNNDISLANLGWQPFFHQQLNLDEWEEMTPVRVMEHHRAELELQSEQGAQRLALLPSMPAMTVGDWLLLDSEGRFGRLLDRKSCFRRRAAGSAVSEQLIAANVDTAFIVVSLNEDFNLNRIERYLSVVNEAGSEPVVVLSKMDLCAAPDTLAAQVRALDGRLLVETVNGLDAESVAPLRDWCRAGTTVVLLGSSGSGKSTLTNTLLGRAMQETGAIRDSDDKGRHTTTRRSLLAMDSGAMILDTPGMRELQLTDCAAGVEATFSDIEALAANCRFGDCQHGAEPGCAVLQALEEGELDERRLDNYRKLMREQALNAASLAERRAESRALGRFYKRVQKEAKHFKGQ
jgi:ribosome biogenesis GTPase